MQVAYIIVGPVTSTSVLFTNPPRILSTFVARVVNEPKTTYAEYPLATDYTYSERLRKTKIWHKLTSCDLDEQKDHDTYISH